MNTPLKAIILISIGIIISTFVVANNRSDSIRLKKFSKVIYADTTIVIKNDTVIAKDASIVKIKKRFFVKFYNNYVVADTNEHEQRKERFNSYEGKIVGEIKLKKLEPFGTNIMDTSLLLEDWLIKGLNSAHFNTRDRIVLNNLIFKKGDVLQSFTLDESERVLRTIKYFLDARIVGIPRSENADTIDILVIAKDVFSIGLRLGINEINEIELGINNINMFGLGHQLKNKFIIATDQRLGYEGQYRVQNLGGSFLTGELQYANTIDSHYAGIDVFRNFITPQIKNAGGFRYNVRNEKFPRSRSTLEIDPFRLGYHTIDGWYGRSFNIKAVQPTFQNRSNFIISARNTTLLFFERPTNVSDTTREFQSRTLVLGNFGFSKRNYYKDILILGFGRTEDVPIGRLIEFTSGIEIGQEVNRYYAGMRFSYGHKFDKFGYINSTVEIGSFFYNGPEQGAVKLNSTYFSNLLSHKRPFKQRFFFKTEYNTMLNSFAIFSFDLKGIKAVRGLNSNIVRGTKSISFQFTHTLFSPWRFLGFRLAFDALTDLGYITTKDKFVFDSRPYWGIGFGLKINNENLNLGTINLRIVIYPAAPDDVSVFGLALLVNPRLLLPDFDSKKPKTVWFDKSVLD